MRGEGIRKGWMMKGLVYTDIINDGVITANTEILEVTERSHRVKHDNALSEGTRFRRDGPATILLVNEPVRAIRNGSWVK
ncbi:MAG: hypothetical protein IPK35_12545 [Saprospiraceae bacterium]|jgi:hypothetical protein|nr:hypothetical protein [Saprospiraceae bacterium]